MYKKACVCSVLLNAFLIGCLLLPKVFTSVNEGNIAGTYQSVQYDQGVTLILEEDGKAIMDRQSTGNHQEQSVLFGTWEKREEEGERLVELCFENGDVYLASFHKEELILPLFTGEGKHYAGVFQKVSEISIYQAE